MPFCKQADQLQANSRILGTKLREADKRAQAAESLAEAHKRESQSLEASLKAAETALEDEKRERTKSIRELQEKLSATSQTHDAQSFSSIGPIPSPEGKSTC